MPNTTHTWLLGPLLDSVVRMTYIPYIRDLKIIYCMKNNDKDLVSSCFEYMSNNANSILGNKIIIIIIVHIYIAHYSHCALTHFLKTSYTLTKYT